MTPPRMEWFDRMVEEYGMFFALIYLNHTISEIRLYFGEERALEFTINIGDGMELDEAIKIAYRRE